MELTLLFYLHNLSDFSVSTTQACFGESVSFTDLSTSIQIVGIGILVMEIHQLCKIQPIPILTQELITVTLTVSNNSGSSTETKTII